MNKGEKNKIIDRVHSVCRQYALRCYRVDIWNNYRAWEVRGYDWGIYVIGQFPRGEGELQNDYWKEKFIEDVEKKFGVPCKVKIVNYFSYKKERK